jgi:hypothetical protein
MPKHVGAIYLLSHILTPQSRVLLGKLAGLQLVKKFPAFHGTKSFIKAFASAHRSNIRIHFYVSSVNSLVVWMNDFVKMHVINSVKKRPVLVSQVCSWSLNIDSHAAGPGISASYATRSWSVQNSVQITLFTIISMCL